MYPPKYIGENVWICMNYVQETSRRINGCQEGSKFILLGHYPKMKCFNNLGASNGILLPVLVMEEGGEWLRKGILISTIKYSYSSDTLPRGEQAELS